ncbi:MAG: mycofactocin biosynthesis peptidyl-dipeptidase MftE [Ilumatobacteraceae bacterium]
MRLNDVTWPDVVRPVLCVPLGSCEQHGPHLPFGTDTIIAEALADELAARRPGIVVAPAIAVTASGEHAGFPGTLSIGSAVMATVVVELVRSADWADGVVLVNGHGGNREAVDCAVTTLGGEGRRVLSWWPVVDGGDAHAGHTETSLLLALRPDVVRRDRAVAGETASLGELAGRLQTHGVQAVSPNGVLGDPTGADAALGRAMFEQLAARLLAAVEDWAGARR